MNLRMSNPTFTPSSGRVSRAMRRVRYGASLAMKAGELWSTHHVARTAAALAFYTLFSLAPILVIATAIAGLVWGVDAVQGQLVAELSNVVGPDGGRLIQEMIANAYRSTQTGFIAGAGLVAVLVGATAVFAELRFTFEDLWDQSNKPKTAGLGGVVLTLLKARLRGLAVVVGIGFVLLASLVLSSTLVALAQVFKPSLEELPAVAWLIALVPLAVSLAITTAMLAALLRVLLPVPVPPRRLAGAALFGAVLFEFAKAAVALYLGHSAVTSTFGAAGSLAVLLIWLYVAAAIVLLCAVVLRAMSADAVPPPAA
jgi:membrane protein